MNLLRLKPIDGAGELVTLEAMRDSKMTIWEMAAQRFGENNPLPGGWTITQPLIGQVQTGTPAWRAASRSRSVSYTHLDVYKRQDHLLREGDQRRLVDHPVHGVSADIAFL